MRSAGTSAPYNPPDAFAGQHALITGGGSGIGAACAKLLVAQGARVTITGRDEHKLAQTAEEIGTRWTAADVTDEGAVHRAFEQVRKASGPITILINNAGVADACPFVRMSPDFWSHIIQVNLTGVFLCTREVIRPMLDEGRGRIVNVASVASLEGGAYISAYSAAKHGVLGLTRSLAKEFAGKGVTVNAVCPAFVNTQIVTNAIENIVSKTGRSKHEALSEMLASAGQRRLLEPHEVAEVVIDLCQPTASHKNGRAIRLPED